MRKPIKKATDKREETKNNEHWSKGHTKQKRKEKQGEAKINQKDDPKQENEKQIEIGRGGKTTKTNQQGYDEKGKRKN